jgi:DNA repair protein RecO (recombination protein O)
MLKTRGIVLKTIKYGETSVITNVFTEEKGVRTFIAGGVRTPKTRMPFALFQPVSIVELVSYFREGDKNMNRLKEVRAAEIYSAIPFDLRRGAVALLMAEVCNKCLHDAEEHRDLFHFMVEQLLWLDTTPHPVANIHLHFLLHLSGYLGFETAPEVTSDDMYFDLREGLSRPVPPHHPDYLTPEQGHFWNELLQCHVDVCHTIIINRAERSALLEKILAFYKLHVPGLHEIHTTTVLNSVFNG